MRCCKAPGCTNSRDAHLVGGQSSRFVGADYVRTAKGLNAGKIPDNRILLGHFFCSKGKACGDHGGETLRDGSNSKCHSDLEVINSTVDRASVGWIPEVPEVDDPDEDTNDGDDFSEQVTEV